MAITESSNSFENNKFIFFVACVCPEKRDYDISVDTDISGRCRTYVGVTIIQSVFTYNSRLYGFSCTNTELQWIFFLYYRVAILGQYFIVVLIGLFYIKLLVVYDNLNHKLSNFHFF